MKYSGTLVCVDEESKLEELQFLSDIKGEVTIVTSRPEILEKIIDSSFESVIYYQDELSLIEADFSRIAKVVIYGESFMVIQRYARTLKILVNVPIVVITNNKQYPTDVYKKLGVKVVIFSQSPTIGQFVV